MKRLANLKLLQYKEWYMLRFMFVIATVLFSVQARAAGVHWMAPAKASAGAITPQSIPYNNGRVLANVHIIPVMWGSGVDSSMVSDMQTLYSTLASSRSLVNYLAEYNTPTQTFGIGLFERATTITPTHTGTTIYDDGVNANQQEIKDELTAQIQAGNLPRWDNNAVYMVHMPPGITVVTAFGTSCAGANNGFCGYHDYNPASFGAYAVIADHTVGGCAPTPPGTHVPSCGDQSSHVNEGITASHELLEAMTDPLPTRGWYGPPGATNEIGDPCRYPAIWDNYRSTIDGVQAQKMWSNSANACVAIQPTTLCCADPFGQNIPCYGIGSGEVCPPPNPSAGASTATVATVPVVPGDRYALSMHNFACFNWTGGVAAPASGACSIFTSGGYSAVAPWTTACFAHPTNPSFPNTVQTCIARPAQISCPSGWTRSAPTVCCRPVTSSIDSGGRLCGSGIVNLTVH
jgi:hypothetical protein